MRISDWSSDVCSSDLGRPELQRHHRSHGRRVVVGEHGQHQPVLPDALHPGADVGYQRARGPEPVVVALERVEHAAQRVPVASVGTWPPQGDLAPMLARRMRAAWRSEEHTSELQSLMRISYAVFCLKKKKTTRRHQ